MQTSQHHPIPRRATAEQLPPHRAGHSFNHHPEDVPYMTDQRKRSLQNPLDLAENLDYPGERTRQPTSAIRYVDTRGNPVIRQGKRQFILHDEPPPNRRPHWLLIFGIGMMLMLLMYVGYTAFTNWWTNHQLDTTYEYPRVFQADAVVYPGDTEQHPSHYLFLNLNGTVEIIELPHGQTDHARSYKGPTIFSDNADQVPVTGEFRVVNGKIEMLVHIQNQTIIFVNDGTEFKPVG